MKKNKQISKTLNLNQLFITAVLIALFNNYYSNELLLFRESMNYINHKSTDQSYNEMTFQRIMPII